MNKKIKLFDPAINHLEEKKVLEVLHSGNWASGSGKGNVKKFENSFQKSFIKEVPIHKTIVEEWDKME